MFVKTWILDWKKTKLLRERVSERIWGVEIRNLILLNRLFVKTWILDFLDGIEHGNFQRFKIDYNKKNSIIIYRPYFSERIYGEMEFKIVKKLVNFGFCVSFL